VSPHSKVISHTVEGELTLGDALRITYLHPDNTIKCFELFEDLPSCNRYYHAKEDGTSSPIPIIGTWLKAASCIVGNVGPDGLGFFCEKELTELNRCLPEKEEVDSAPCSGVLEKCRQSTVLGWQKPLLGAPLPDACTHLETYNGDTDFDINAYENFDINGVIERYDSFLSRSDGCVEVWDGWTVEGTLMNEDSGVDGGRAGAIAGAFFGGMAAGLLIFILLSFLKQNKKESGNAKNNAEYERTVVGDGLEEDTIT